MQQFPRAFEFNEEFLLCVADHHLSCLYGTFLFNTELERLQHGLPEKTESLWTDLLRSQATVNPHYSPEQSSRVLYPDCEVRHLRVWEAMWMRHERAVALS